MNYSIKLYLGVGLDKDNQPLHEELVEAAIKRAEYLLSEAYGGCTATYGDGSWVNSNGEVVTEDCIIFESIVAEIQHDKLKSIANELKARLAQESVLLTIQALILKEFI